MMYNDRQEYEYECERAAQIELERQAELAQLRDLLRWRKMSEEKPPCPGRYLIYINERGSLRRRNMQYLMSADYDGKWVVQLHGTRVLWWRPHGPLPEDM